MQWQGGQDGILCSTPFIWVGSDSTCKLQSNGEENEENEEYAIFHLHPIYPAIHQPYRNQVRLSLVALLSITTWHSSQTPLLHAIPHLHKA